MELFRVFDNFCPTIDSVRESALASGFGTWAPNKGLVGSSVYTGMSFWGNHAELLHPLMALTGKVVYPNAMNFRISNTDSERAYIHSDRHSGAHTAIVYMTDHDDVSGTAFWRHRRTGLIEMPTVEKQHELGIFDELKEDMVSGAPEKWEQLDFVRGIKNRCLVFAAPLFHSRFPIHGIGSSETDGRMIWACHHYILGPKGGLA